MLLQKRKVSLISGLILAAVAIALISVVLSVAKKRQAIPPQTLPQTSLPPTEQQFSLKYSYLGELPTLQRSAPVYTFEGEQMLNQERALELAAPWGYSGEPQSFPDTSGTVFVFTDTNTSLTIYSSPAHLEYIDFTEKPLAAMLSEEELLNTASLFLSQRLSHSRLFALSKPYITYKTSDGFNMFDTSSLEQADYVELRYTYTLESLPVISKETQDHPIVLLLNVDGSVRKASITLFTENLTPLGTTQLTKPQEALNAVNSGLGTISTLHDPEVAYTQVQPQSITQAAFHSLELIYIYDADNRQILPYYRFSGIATTIDERRLEIEVLLTALPQEVFQK
ncbi:MAG: hypothetical protein ACOX6V_01525 [Patescibacteria group bacterium]|jgi:hypothetical protein